MLLQVHTLCFMMEDDQLNQESMEQYFVLNDGEPDLKSVMSLNADFERLIHEHVISFKCSYY